MVKFRDYQLEDITRWVNLGYRALWAWDPGLGKTFVSGFISKRMIATKRADVVAIFCPASVLSTWIHHLVEKVGIKKEDIFLAYKKNKRNIYKGQRFILLNYEMIYNESKKTKKQKASVRMVMNSEGRMELLQDKATEKGVRFRGVKLPVKPDMWILDESHALKNPDGIAYKFFKDNIAPGDKVLALSGTPAPNRHVDCYTQVDILKPGVLGTNIHHFHNRHCLCIDKQYGLWAVKPSAIPVIEKAASEVWMFRDAKKILGLPDHTDIFEPYYPTPEQKSYINMLCAEGMACFNNEAGSEQSIVLKSPGVARIMSQQVLTGYVDMEVTEAFTNRKVSVIKALDMEPKYTALKSILNKVNGRKILVWTHFKPTMKYLVERLAADGYKVDGFSSDDKKNLETRIKEFTDGDIQILVSHPKILGIGRNEFAQVPYMAWYELTDDWGLYKQAVTRIDRFGKTEPTFSFILMGSRLDRKIYDALCEKKDVDTALRSYTGEETSPDKDSASDYPVLF